MSNALVYTLFYIEQHVFTIGLEFGLGMVVCMHNLLTTITTLHSTNSIFNIYIYI